MNLYLKKVIFRYSISILFLVSILFLNKNVNSQPFHELLPELILKDESINASKILINKADNDLASAKSGFSPKVSITMPYGYEHQINSNAENSHLVFHEYNMKITQNILDFGATRSNINMAKTGIKIADISKNNIKSNKIYESLSAYLNYIRAYRVQEFSKKSENRIIEVSNLEDAKVSRGGGLATNVLQSKARLAGAKSSTSRSVGDVAIASNRFYNVFRKRPNSFETFAKPILPIHLIPNTLNEAIDIATKNNIALKVSNLSLISSDFAVKSAKAKFFPSLQAVAEYKNKRDSSGVIGTEIDQIFKFELSYPFSLGGPGVLFYKERADYKSAVNSYLSSKYAHDQMRRNIEESVRNAWQTKITSKATAEHLLNQANISGEFFDLAMKEVQLGNRQLIDVLSSETSYIESISAAESASTDYELSVYQLLLSMGILNEEIFYKKATDSVIKKSTISNDKDAKKDFIAKESKNLKSQLVNINEVKKDISFKEISDIKETKNLLISLLENDSEAKISSKLNLEKNSNTSKYKSKKENVYNPTNLLEDNLKISKTIKIKASKRKDIIINKGFKLQLGAFKSLTNAKRYLYKLGEDKIDFITNSSLLIENINIVEKNNLYRLQSYNTYNKINAKQICKDFKNSGYSCILIKI